MTGYIISDKNEINVENYEIKSFDILHKTDLNIFVIKNNKVLEWFKNSRYEFKYDVRAINYASSRGEIQVLEWFRNSSYEFKYNLYAIIHASKNGYVQVLEWFKNSDYKFKYDKWAIYYAFKNKYLHVLKFYSNNINIKKLIKWTDKNIFIKTIKFKTNHKYLKGYQKN